MGVIKWKNQIDTDAKRVHEELVVTNKLTIEERAKLALEVNKTFYNRTSSTTAQVLAEVKALARQNNGIIRLLLEQLDSTD